MKTTILFISLILAGSLVNAGVSGTSADGQTTYGADNERTGYGYVGIAFDCFKGTVTEGNTSSPDLNGDFGGDQVTLTGFQGEFNNRGVQLSWKTMMEKHIDHYEIERSGDGLHFSEIGSTPSKMTITTNDFQLLYNYTDQNPLPGTSYYRVKVIGKDDFTNQSAIVQINNKQPEGIKIYPTLIQNNQVFVETDKTLREAKLEFFDLSGKKLSETSWESLSGRQHCTVSGSNRLPAGTYLVRLTSNGQTIKNQLMIVQGY